MSTCACRAEQELSNGHNLPPIPEKHPLELNATEIQRASLPEGHSSEIQTYHFTTLPPYHFKTLNISDLVLQMVNFSPQCYFYSCFFFSCPLFRKILFPKKTEFIRQYLIWLLFSFNKIRYGYSQVSYHLKTMSVPTFNCYNSNPKQRNLKYCFSLYSSCRLIAAECIIISLIIDCISQSY